MAAADTSKNSSFRYIWTIENFSDLTYIDLQSPKFVIKSIGDTVWKVKIDEYAGFFFVIRSNDFSEEKSNGIDFEFSFLGADGSQLVSKTSSGPRLVLHLLDRAPFLKRWAEFIPNNTLTVQCRMWRRDREIPTDVCYARTRLKTHTGSFVWAIEDFSALKSSGEEHFSKLKKDEKRVYSIKPFTKKGPFNALILYIKNKSESEHVCAGFLIEKGRDYAFSCELSILDANGKVVVSKERRGRTDYGWAILTFPSLILKNELISSKDLFLPNDTLVLRCSFEVCSGVISNEIEYFTPNVSSVIEEEEEVLNFHVAGAEADDTLIFEEYFYKEGKERRIP